MLRRHEPGTDSGSPARTYDCRIPSFSYEKGIPDCSGIPHCGAKGIRTPDPLHAMEMRYQLRHSPVCNYQAR